MVEIQEEYSGGGQTTQIFDELRRRVRSLNAFRPGLAYDRRGRLGDIYGIMYAVSAGLRARRDS